MPASVVRLLIVTAAVRGKVDSAVAVLQHEVHLKARVVGAGGRFQQLVDEILY